MPSDVIMPALGMSQETGKVLRWLKAEGETVAKGEPLLEIETDKVTVEIEAPAAGTLAGVCAAEGDDVPVGEVIALVLADGEVAAAPAAPPARPRRPLASPKARRLAREAGVDVGALAGSGPNGAVLAADVPARVAAPRPVPANGSVWRVMAARTTESWQTVPHFYLRREVDASRLRTWRDVVRTKPGQARASITDLLVKLAAESLARHRVVNATWDGAAPALLDRVNVGIAVAVDDGLVVPVVHDADRLTLAEVVARRTAAVEAARAGQLRPEDVSGGTFTVSNLGMFGVDGFDAIVNAPQAAILAVGRIVDRLVPVDGQPAVRPMLQLSVSFDHRVVDGARGAAFLETLASLVEEPAGLVA
jgi:pyruvate dehydrogenase E2 component (dihydrolipoyllysine-residue acetyltransferase)